MLFHLYGLKNEKVHIKICDKCRLLLIKCRLLLVKCRLLLVKCRLLLGVDDGDRLTSRMGYSTLSSQFEGFRRRV